MYNFVMSTVISIYPSTVRGIECGPSMDILKRHQDVHKFLHFDSNVNSILPKDSFDK